MQIGLNLDIGCGINYNLEKIIVFVEDYCETPIPKANNLNTLNNLRVTIGVLEFVGRINETQILQTQCSNICKLNYPLRKAHRDIPAKQSIVPHGLL